MSGSARNLEHPVWEAYDLLRTTCLNIKYYSRRAAQVARRNFWLELILALTATGSAVGGLWFWEEPLWSIVWKLLLVLSAILAVAKPLLKWTDAIQVFETLVGKYRVAENEAKKLISDIQFSREYREAHKARLHQILDRMSSIAQEKGGDHNADQQILQDCQRAVAVEYPADRFFIPQ